MTVQDIITTHRYRLGGTCTCGEWNEEDYPSQSFAEHVAAVFYDAANDGELEDVELGTVRTPEVLPAGRNQLRQHVEYALRNHPSGQEDCDDEGLACSNPEHLTAAVLDQVEGLLRAYNVTVPA